MLHLHHHPSRASQGHTEGYLLSTTGNVVDCFGHGVGGHHTNAGRDAFLDVRLEDARWHVGGLVGWMGSYAGFGVRLKGGFDARGLDQAEGN